MGELIDSNESSLNDFPKPPLLKQDQLDRNKNYMLRLRSEDQPRRVTSDGSSTVGWSIKQMFPTNVPDRATMQAAATEGTPPDGLIQVGMDSVLILAHNL